MALNINGTTGISGVDGSVSAPAVTGTDSNTGITFPSADTIKFSTGGVERMQISNSGVTGTGISAGKILQVIQTQSSTTVTATSETDLLTLSITPSSASNKILVSFNVIVWITPSGNAFANAKLYRGTSSGTQISYVNGGNGSNNYNYTYLSNQELDSPNTTSAQTYTVAINKSSGNTTNVSTDNMEYNMVAMEVAA